MTAEQIREALEFCAKQTERNGRIGGQASWLLHAATLRALLDSGFIEAAMEAFAMFERNGTKGYSPPWVRAMEAYRRLTEKP